ncbi:MAG: hypothetical protein ACK4SA_10555 [Caldilinea sp.]
MNASMDVLIIVVMIALSLKPWLWRIAGNQVYHRDDILANRLQVGGYFTFEAERVLWIITFGATVRHVTPAAMACSGRPRLELHLSQKMCTV